jgi:hypothetical protein
MEEDVINVLTRIAIVLQLSLINGSLRNIEDLLRKN